jgi:hypothetical protein
MAYNEKRRSVEGDNSAGSVVEKAAYSMAAEEQRESMKRRRRDNEMEEMTEACRLNESSISVSYQWLMAKAAKL